MKSDRDVMGQALRSVLCAGAIAALFIASVATGQEDGADDEEKDVLELGRQVVTGSRIKRIDVEEARPVVIITREDIELSGQESVADVLRNSPVNSFGSSREVSGNAWIGQATIDLHGIGANRSLVLLDGRRMPRSPVTANQAVDLNIIPLAAVERIEILTDSASAIYGSDAIGGVINIILRKDYEGIEIGASLDQPTREGADAESGVITLGGATDRGRYVFSADFRNKAHIASADRFYTRGGTGYAAGAADYPNAPFPATWHAWGNADNVSSWGNTIWPHYLAAPNCEQAVDPATGEAGAGRTLHRSYRRTALRFPLRHLRVGNQRLEARKYLLACRLRIDAHSHAASPVAVQHQRRAWTLRAPAGRHPADRGFSCRAEAGIRL